MKKLWSRAKKHPSASLYLLGACVLLAGMLLNFAADTFGYATGRLREQTLTLNNTSLYTLVNMTYDGSILTADNGDAQLLLEPGQHIRSLHLTAEYLTPGTNEMDLYYHLPGSGYTPLLRVWPALASDGISWDYRIPLWAGQNNRLDLADQGGVQLRVEHIVLNKRPAWYTYFVPSLWQLFWLAVLPGLAACLAAWGKEICGTGKKHREGNEC